MRICPIINGGGKMFQGTINIVTDLNLAMQCASQGCKVAWIGDPLSESPANGMFIPLPLLAPDYQVLSAEIEGNMEAYAQLYSQQLSTREAFLTFMALFACIYSDQNVILYIEEGDQLSHAGFLQQYVFNTFNVMIGTAGNPFQINELGRRILFILLFDSIDGLILPEEFLSMVDTELLRDLLYSNPYLSDILNRVGMTLDQIRDYQSIRAAFFDARCAKYNLVIKK